MGSYSDIAIADLRDLAQKISVKSYGTKGDIINRLNKHAAGPSMLQTLAEKAQKEKTLKGKLKKKEGTTEGTTDDRAVHVQERLPLNFCKNFGIKLVATEKSGDGVTTYTYLPTTKPSTGPTKTICKKKTGKGGEKLKEKKPDNAYILFQKEERETMKQEGWTGDPKETMSECARRWQQVDPDTKSKFFALAKQVKEDWLAKKKAAAEKAMDVEEGDKASPIDLSEDDELDAKKLIKGEEEEEDGEEEDGEEDEEDGEDEEEDEEDEEDEEEEDGSCEFKFFFNKLKKTFSDARPLVNKNLKKYKPATSYKKIKSLSDAEALRHLADAMFYDKEEGL